MTKLTVIQKEALKEILKVKVLNDFYLAGGTAISIKYSHRYSEDFDFFLKPEVKIDFFSLLSKIKPEKVLTLREDTLIILFRKIKFSFFYYPYPLIENLLPVAGLGIQIASDCDISAMKSIAIIQRGEKKDFFDLWFLMEKNKWKISDIISFSLRKFKTVFNPSLFVKAIVYYDDAENQKIPDMENKWDEVKAFFEEEVLKYLGKL